MFYLPCVQLAERHPWQCDCVHCSHTLFNFITIILPILDTLIYIYLSFEFNFDWWLLLLPAAESTRCQGRRGRGRRPCPRAQSSLWWGTPWTGWSLPISTRWRDAAESLSSAREKLFQKFDYNTWLDWIKSCQNFSIRQNYWAFFLPTCQSASIYKMHVTIIENDPGSPTKSQSL